MLTKMDQNTIAKMTAALEYVCKKIPPDKDSNALRKRCRHFGDRVLIHLRQHLAAIQSELV